MASSLPLRSSYQKEENMGPTRREMGYKATPRRNVRFQGESQSDEPLHQEAQGVHPVQLKIANRQCKVKASTSCNGLSKLSSRNILQEISARRVFGCTYLGHSSICVHDFDAVMNKGFWHGYSFITVFMILNHALSGISVSMVMECADNILKVGNRYTRGKRHTFWWACSFQL